MSVLPHRIVAPNRNVLYSGVQCDGPPIRWSVESGVKPCPEWKDYDTKEKAEKFHADRVKGKVGAAMSKLFHRDQMRGKAEAVAPEVPAAVQFAQNADSVAQSARQGEAEVAAKKAEEARRRQEQLARKVEVMQKWLAYSLKFSAGVVRFIAEDILNGWCQLVYLAKCWRTKELTEASRWFTLVSIVVGISCAAARPTMDCIKSRRLGDSYTVVMVQEVDVVEDVAAEGKVPEGEGKAADVQPELSRADHQLLQVRKPNAKERRDTKTYFLATDTVENFIRGDSTIAKNAHRLLVIAGGIFWLAMAIIPVLFGKEMTRGNVPNSTVTHFALTAGVCIFLELWVVVHTGHGLSFIQHMDDHFRNVFKCHTAGANGMTALILSLLGCYDTFSDIVFTMILFKDAESTHQESTWFTVAGRKFDLYVPLKYISLFAVVCIIYLCQAMPG